MNYQHIEVVPLTPRIGAEIRGVDLSQPMAAPVMAEVRQALWDHLMLYFRNQSLDADTFTAFGKQIGPLHDEPFIPKHASKEGLYQFRGVTTQQRSVQSLRWHVDHSYAAKPTLAGVLYATDVPASGGDTLFANMYAAYDALSDEMKRILDPMYAIHDILSYGLSSGHYSMQTPQQIESLKWMREKFPQVEHPVVCRHPETGRPYLFLNPCWVVGFRGLSTEEGAGLLSALNAHLLKTEFQCRFHWQNGTVGMWDNRCVLHSPGLDYVGPRAMLRLAIDCNHQPIPWVETRQAA
ncbi:MAG: TauD/TfdA family dioxygenase [Gammaproteobacteria bacterium]